MTVTVTVLGSLGRLGFILNGGLAAFASSVRSSAFFFSSDPN